jgi:4-amino-4-deoxy-L-arabinose transferase-like glycosyltransferase
VPIPATRSLTGRSEGCAELRTDRFGATRGVRRALGAIVLVALLVRIAAVLATPHAPLPADPRDYDRHARAIAATGSYPSTVLAADGPTAIRPPGYPYVLGGVYALTGDSARAGRMAQAVIGSALVALLALVALELFGAPAALAAGALAAIFPPLVIDGMTLLSEPLFVTLELAAVLAVLLWQRTARRAWLLAAGALAGIALLTRANAVALILPLAFAVRQPGSWRSLRTYRAPAVFVACTVLVVLPWTIRNLVQFHSFVPISDQDGVTLAGTYNATSRAAGGAWIIATRDPAMLRLYQANRHLDEVALSAKFRQAARRFAVDHPGYVLKVAARNLRFLFNLGGNTRTQAAAGYGLGPAWGTLMTWGLFPVLLLAAGGMFTNAARAAPRWLWTIPVLLLPTVFVLAANRHRAAIDPFLLLLAGLALTSLYARRAASHPRAP